MKRFWALLAIASLAACAGGNCNCTVPDVRTATSVPVTIATTVPTTAPTTIATTIPTTGPNGLPTTVPVVIATTVPIVVATTLPTTVPVVIATLAPVLVITPAPVIPPVIIASTCAQNAVAGQGVPLGSDAGFAVLAGSTVTNAGLSIVTGDLGVSPGSAVAGFGPGVVVGAIHAGDPAAAQGQLDLTSAYNNAAGRVNPLAVPADIGGLVIAPGLYRAPVSLAVTGNVTLDGQNNPNAVFIFQMASTLITSVNSSVTLINGANACNIFWQVGSSATIGTGSVFSGNVLAFASISLGTGATVNGRLLARAGAVTLLTNLVTKTDL